MNLLLSMPGSSEWILIFFVLGGLSLFVLIPKIFYLLTLQSTLNNISPENRKMQPSNVWLLLIPLFSLIYHFYVIKYVAESIRAEADSMGRHLAEPMPAYHVGLAMCILNCLVVVPGVNILTSIAGLVCWIVYWVKIADYKNILSTEKMTFIGSRG